MRDLGIGIIGTGRVGKAIAIELARKDWRIAGMFDIDPEIAKSAARFVPTGVFKSAATLARRSDILFLSVPDGQIVAVAESLGELERYKARFLFHFSGILPSRILRLAGMDRAIYSLHPFGGISKKSASSNPFKNLYFSGEGDFAAQPIAKKITTDLEGSFIEINPGGKPAYHLAASFVANHLFALLASADSLLANSGIPHEYIQTMIYEIAQSALDNFRNSGLSGGLTGPLTRRDELTVAEHLVIAEKYGLRELYEVGLKELRKLVNSSPR